MNKLFAALVCLFAFLVVSGCNNRSNVLPPLADANIDDDTDSVAATAGVTKRLQDALDEIYSKNQNAVGILVHVEAPDHEISWSGACGFADIENETKLEPDQPAILASNTKTYVSAALLRLVEDKKLGLEFPIGDHLNVSTLQLLKDGGYDVSKISIEHLLNHTSGIFDYNSTEGHFEFISNNLKHEWTKEEQLLLAMKGTPVGQPGEIFSYADTNYVLLCEIIERSTGEPFYTAIRNLINYEKFQLNKTWWLIFEDQPATTKPLVKQYFSELGWDSSELHQSFDLQGGGGIAGTSKELALFVHNLFNHKVFKERATLERMKTVTPKSPVGFEYMLGLSKIDVDGKTGYGHGGFWGTCVNHFPELNASISIVVLERDVRSLRPEINRAMIQILSNIKQ